MFNINNYSITPNVLPHFIAGMVIIFLTFKILKRENFSLPSLFFSSLASCFIIWLWSDLAILSAKTASKALLWSKVQAIGVVFISPAAYWFVISIINKAKYYKPFAIVSLALSSVLTVFIIFTNLFVKGVYHYSWGFYAKYNSFLSILFLGFFTLFLFAITFHFWSEYANAKSQKEKYRFKLFLINYFIATFAAIDFIPAFGINVFPFGCVFILIFMIGLFILVKRYDLMDLSHKFASQQIISTMTDILLLMNKDGIIQFANPSAIDFFGIEETKIVGKHALQVIQDSNFANNFNKILKTGFINDYEITYLKNENDKRFLSLSILSIKNALRQTLAMVFIGKDRTEYKKSEDELKKAFAVPKTIIEGISVGIVVYDELNKVRQINKTALNLLGLKSEREAVNKSYKIKVSGNEGEKSDLRTINGLKTKEELITASDGKTISVLKTSLPIVIDDEKLFLDVFVDISDRKDLEQKLNEYKTYLEKLVQERANELEQANTQLMGDVTDRKKMEEDLRFYINDLEKFQKITIDRENKMTELKEEANRLAQELGRPELYKI